jgi:hypothetical protein
MNALFGASTGVHINVKLSPRALPRAQVYTRYVVLFDPAVLSRNPLTKLAFKFLFPCSQTGVVLVGLRIATAIGRQHDGIDLAHFFHENGLTLAEGANAAKTVF